MTQRQLEEQWANDHNRQPVGQLIYFTFKCNRSIASAVSK